MSIENLLAELQDREVDRLEGKILQLTEKIYPELPARLAQCSALTGIEEELLMKACIHAAWPIQGREWYQVLEEVRSVFLAKQRLEGGSR